MVNFGIKFGSNNIEKNTQQTQGFLSGYHYGKHPQALQWQTIAQVFWNLHSYSNCVQQNALLEVLFFFESKFATIARGMETLSATFPTINTRTLHFDVLQ